MEADQTFDVSMVLKKWTATIKDTAASGDTLGNVTITGSTGCGSGTTDGGGNITFTDIVDGTNCAYTASAANFHTTTSPPQVMDANKNFTIKLDPILWTATVTVKSNAGGNISGANVTSSNPSCGQGTTDGNGNAIIFNLLNGSVCSYKATASGYYDGNSETRTMTSDQNFTIGLDKIPPPEKKITFAFVTKKYFTGSDELLGVNLSNFNLHVTCNNGYDSGNLNQNSNLTLSIGTGANCTATASDTHNALNYQPVMDSIFNVDNDKTVAIYLSPSYDNVYDCGRDAEGYALNYAPANPGACSHLVPATQIEGYYNGEEKYFPQVIPQRMHFYTLDGNGTEAPTVQSTTGNWWSSSNPLYWSYAPLSNSNTVISIYTSPINGKQYRMMRFNAADSPVKIGLDKKDAIVTDNGSFKLIRNGINSPTAQIMLTSGGLNPNEAWLAYFENNKVVAYKNGALNESVLFGDHGGVYPNGYENLKNIFPNFVQKDNKGIEYIELKPLSWWQKLWNWVLSLFGIQADITPYDTLKLITADHHIIPAYKVISRINVTYYKVKEVSPSGANTIDQRSTVYYQDGGHAESGDMWYTSKNSK